MSVVSGGEGDVKVVCVGGVRLWRRGCGGLDSVVCVGSVRW